MKCKPGFQSLLFQIHNLWRYVLAKKEAQTKRKAKNVSKMAPRKAARGGALQVESS
jgi:hypothetical protein